MTRSKREKIDEVNCTKVQGGVIDAPVSSNEVKKSYLASRGFRFRCYALASGALGVCERIKHKTPREVGFCVLYGAPGEIRTPDLLVRSQALYPTELRAQKNFSIHRTAVAIQAASAQRKLWRRERDSNPRWAFDPYALSRGAPSTTRPSLRSQFSQTLVK
jgi:hypothetical protein